ncbi:MAG: hypothetical protein Q9227_003393 [Pyrenula ochraceoflavens]
MDSIFGGFELVEPHPTTPSTGYIHTGRGGAGNIVRAKNISSGPNATGRASVTSLGSSRSTPYHSGRGGAGNVNYSIDAERAIFSFDEELERQMQQERDLPPVHYVGRGGRGNMVYNDTSSRPRSSIDSARSLGSDDSASSADSTSSDPKNGDGNGKLRRVLEKGWWKIKGVA